MTDSKFIYRDNWEKIELPHRVIKEKETEDPYYTKFIIEPLYKGFGTTIGNALRRALLSSLVGCAVTSIKIEEVPHEFDSIKGVREDVLNIILNLKQVQFAPLVEEEYFNVNLSVKGPKVVTAKDIDTKGILEIKNSDEIICHIDEPVDLNISIQIRLYRGIVSSQENKNPDLPVGTIFLESNHCPVQRVHYEVLNTRVKQKTDFDKLVFAIWTNGSLTPEDALAFGSKILKDSFSSLINFNEDDFVDEEEVDEEPEEESVVNPHVQRSVNELDLTVRSINCLQNAKIDTIGDLIQKTEQEMLKTKNFGKKSLQEIKTLLASMGLTLGMQLKDGKFVERPSIENDIIT